MLAPTLLLFLLAAPQSAPAAKTRLDRVIDLATSDCARTPEAIGCAQRANGRHRLPLHESEVVDRKADALAETGRPCALIGQTICQGRRQTIVKTDETGEVTAGQGTTQALTSPKPGGR